MLGGDAAPAHWRRRRGPRRPEKPSKMRSSCSGGTPGLRSATSATSVEPSSSARTVTSRPATWTRASSARVRDDPLQPPTVGAHREACGHPHRRLGEALHDHGVQQSDLRLRSEQPVAARHHREHQRAAAPILSRRTDLALYSRPTAPRWPLSSTAAPARLWIHTPSEKRRGCCSHPLSAGDPVGLTSSRCAGIIAEKRSVTHGRRIARIRASGPCWTTAGGQAAG